MYRADVDKFFHWDAQMQRFSPQWWRADLQPFWLYFDPMLGANPKPINAAPGGTPTSSYIVPYSSNQGADNWLGNPMEVRTLLFEDSTDLTPNANWTVRLKQVGEARDLMNAPVHVRTLASDAQFPAVLREPLFLPSQASIECQIQKIAGGATTGRLYLSGCQYFSWSPDLLAFPQARQHVHERIRKLMNRRLSVHPYWLTTENGPVQLGASATGLFVIRPGEGSQFEAFTFNCVSTGNFEFEIKEVKSGQTMMNGLITRNNSAGDYQYPTILPCKYLIPGGNFLSLRITDLSGAPNTIWLTIAGRKIYAPIKAVNEAKREVNVVPTPADTAPNFELTPY